MTPMIRLRAVFAILLCTTSLLAHAGDWAHKQKIVLDTTAEGANIAQEVADLPVAVRLHSGNFAFTEAKPDGSDLRFLAADGKTPLKFHLEQFDAPDELAIAWVLVPKLPGNSKAASFEMEWGNPEAASAADAKGSYDAQQLFVLHFSDKDGDRKSTRLNSSHTDISRMPSSA